MCCDDDDDDKTYQSEGILYSYNRFEISNIQTENEYTPHYFKIYN